jgi:hypothetical protein
MGHCGATAVVAKSATTEPLQNLQQFKLHLLHPLADAFPIAVAKDVIVSLNPARNLLHLIRGSAPQVANSGLAGNMHLGHEALKRLNMPKVV